MSVPLSRLSVRSLSNFVRLTTSPLRQNVPPPAFHFAAKNFDCKSFSTSNGLRCVKEGETQPGSSDAAAAPVVEDPVVVERIEHLKIMTIGINRPAKRNCVNEETATHLRRAFEEFEADDEINIAVLHGIGGNFCAGYDLEELASLEQDQLANLMAQHMESGPMGPTRMELTKPTIAAVEGWCVGGGLELALLCDMRIMDSTAQLGVLNRRFGVPLLDGGAVRLPQLIGLSRAMDLIMTGRIVGADEALQIGLVNRICKPGTALGQAVNLAKEISTHPQQCLRVDRDSAIFATFSARNLSQALQYEGENALKVISHEAIQGAKKFASGLGRHGKFNVSPVTEKQEWQKELETMVGNESK